MARSRRTRTASASPSRRATLADVAAAVCSLPVSALSTCLVRRPLRTLISVRAASAASGGRASPQTLMPFCIQQYSFF